MKNVLLIAIGALILNVCAQAQAPSSFPYQAVARNSSGNLLQSQAISLRISIYNGNPATTGTLAYEETQGITHALTTDAFGHFTINIGTGTVVSGSFSSINWGSNAVYIKTEFDPAGGTNFTTMGTSQIESVPYALYAATTGNGYGPTGATGPAGVTGPTGAAGSAGAAGVTGGTGAGGATGATGSSVGYTTTGATFAVPATGATGLSVNVGSNAWMTVGQPIYIGNMAAAATGNGGVYTVTALTGSTGATLTYWGGGSAGATIATGTSVSPTPPPAHMLYSASSTSGLSITSTTAITEVPGMAVTVYVPSYTSILLISANVPIYLAATGTATSYNDITLSILGTSGSAFSTSGTAYWTQPVAMDNFSGNPGRGHSLVATPFTYVTGLTPGTYTFGLAAAQNGFTSATYDVQIGGTILSTAYTDYFYVSVL